MKEVRNFWILEAATDSHSLKIGVPKSMIKLFEVYLSKSFFNKATGNSPKILLKRNSFPNIFQGFQPIYLT